MPSKNSNSSQTGNKKSPLGLFPALVKILWIFTLALIKILWIFTLALIKILWIFILTLF